MKNENEFETQKVSDKSLVLRLLGNGLSVKEIINIKDFEFNDESNKISQKVYGKKVIKAASKNANMTIEDK